MAQHSSTFCLIPFGVVNGMCKECKKTLIFHQNGQNDTLSLGDINVASTVAIRICMYM